MSILKFSLIPQGVTTLNHSYQVELDISLGGANSLVKSILYGILQGSVLGPQCRIKSQYYYVKVPIFRDFVDNFPRFSPDLLTIFRFYVN